MAGKGEGTTIGRERRGYKPLTGKGEDTNKRQGKERIQTIDREGSGKGEDTNH